LIDIRFYGSIVNLDGLDINRKFVTIVLNCLMGWENVLMNDRTLKYLDDDGTQISSDLIPKPDLCLTCKKDGQTAEEENICSLTRDRDRSAGNRRVLF